MTNLTLVPKGRPVPVRPTLVTRVAGLWHAGRRGLYGDDRRGRDVGRLDRLNDRLLRDLGVDRSRT
jgi:hypothetical protein